MQKIFECSNQQNYDPVLKNQLRDDPVLKYHY